MPTTIIYDDTTASTSFDTTFEKGAGNSAFSFTTVAGSAGTLADLKIDLGDATPSDGGTITAYLYSDTGGSGPGTQIAEIGTVADSSLSATDRLVDIPISSTIDLSSITRYWVEFVDSANSSAFLGYNNDDSGTGVANEFTTFQGSVYPNSEGPDVAEVTENSASVDQLPVVTTTSGVTAFAAGTAVPVDSGVTVTDADNTTLASATVSITGNFQSSEDVLAFVNSSATTFGNISGTYDVATGVLTLTSAGATATVQQFQAALEAVTYNDTAATPDSVTRTISFDANDGDGNSLTVTKQLTVADSAQSRLLYDNTVQPALGFDTSFENGSGNSAFSFTTAAGSAGTLADLKIDLGDNTPTDGGIVTAYLYSDTGGSGPGTQIAEIGTVADSSLSATDQLVDIPISSTINLSSDTRYWVEFVDSANSGAFLGYNTDITGTGVANESSTYEGTVYPNSAGSGSSPDVAQVTENSASVDQLPVVTATSGVTAFAAGTAVPVDSGVTVTDADNTTLASATVSITGNFQSSEDVLAFVNSSATTFGNISGTYDAATGVLTLTSAGASATVQQFQAALEAVTYNDTAAKPDSVTRTISFDANDGDGNGATVTKQLTVADSAQSRLLYDNTVEPASSFDTTFENGTGNPAFSFTTATGSSGTLADLKIDFGDDTPTDGGTVTAYLYSDSGGSGPGTQLAEIGTISDSSLSATDKLVDVPISSTILLSSDTRYWVEFVDSANSSAFLGYNTDETGTGVANEFATYQGTVYSNSAGPDVAQVTEGPACYCLGTRILTERGEVAVEDLRIGDTVVTASGKVRPIKWIGTRSYSAHFARRNLDLLPICFKPGSLGNHVPVRPLWVSPKHAMFLDGVLIEAEQLVNGVTILRERNAEDVHYFHIELDSHDVILAEGALSESFIDDDSRGIFHNAHEFAALYPNEEGCFARYCAPRLDSGDEVEAVRQRLRLLATHRTPAEAA